MRHDSGLISKLFRPFPLLRYWHFHHSSYSWETPLVTYCSAEAGAGQQIWIHLTESAFKRARRPHNHHLIPQEEQKPASHPITPDHTHNVFGISMQDLAQQAQRRNDLNQLPQNSIKQYQSNRLVSSKVCSRTNEVEDHSLVWKCLCWACSSALRACLRSVRWESLSTATRSLLMTINEALDLCLHFDWFRCCAALFHLLYSILLLLRIYIV